MRKGIKIVMLITLGLLAVAAFGYITMSLWNWLMPMIFGLPALKFIEALGLLLLAKIFFGFGGGKRWGGNGQHWSWKYRMYNKFQHMSPEERERFKARMKEKWCGWEERASTSKSSDSNV